MIKKIAMVLASVMIISQTAMAAAFTDLEGHWSKEYVLPLAEMGVVDGVTDTLYMPDGDVTRAQYLKMIMEATNLKPTPLRTGECLDADKNDWYGPYLQKALDCGLIPGEMVAGYKESVEYTVGEDGKATHTKVNYSGAFNGELPIRREEMAALTQNVYQYTRGILTNSIAYTDSVLKFSDESDISSWALVSVKQAVANGFMDGTGNNLFDPDNTATRGQAATVILRVINKSNKK